MKQRSRLNRQTLSMTTKLGLAALTAALVAAVIFGWGHKRDTGVTTETDGMEQNITSGLSLPQGRLIFHGEPRPVG